MYNYIYNTVYHIATVIPIAYMYAVVTYSLGVAIYVDAYIPQVLHVHLVQTYQHLEMVDL